MSLFREARGIIHLDSWYAVKAIGSGFEIEGAMMGNLTRIMGPSLMGIVLFASAIGICSASAQTESADLGHWANCDADWPVEDHQSGPNFTVRITFREQPIVGVRVVLTDGDSGQPQGNIVSTAESDSTGVAHFFATPPGTYWVHVEKALLAESKEIQVQADNTAEDKVVLEWPGSPIETRHLDGTVFSWQKSSPQNRPDLLPNRNVLVQLLDLRSGKPLASAHTDSAGYYEFTERPDGLYVIRVAEHKDPSINSYDKAIELTTESIQEHMPDLEVDHVCGKGLLAIADQADRDNTTNAQVAMPNGLNAPK
jgi:hypothetical protein